ncbi:hypothetical protein AMTRI_Chr11g96130 [Amborella trichopoda]
MIVPFLVNTAPPIWWMAIIWWNDLVYTFKNSKSNFYLFIFQNESVPRKIAGGKGKKKQKKRRRNGKPSNHAFWGLAYAVLRILRVMYAWCVLFWGICKPLLYLSQADLDGSRGTRIHSGPTHFIHS